MRRRVVIMWRRNRYYHTPPIMIATLHCRSFEAARSSYQLIASAVCLQIL